jgi:hypothetical protein
MQQQGGSSTGMQQGEVWTKLLMGFDMASGVTY